MWIFLNDAFVSIVAHRDDATKLMVRARRAGDIRRALGVDEDVTPNADYRFRAVVDRDVVAARVAAAVLRVDYPNFKASVVEDERHDAYLDVWQRMLDFQKDARRTRPTRRRHP